MAIDINIPSQVKNYANLAGFPATGTLKTIFIAEDTNKTYRWTGSVYVEISGTDTSSLVPTSRTLTINGTTQDLSADRTFTISTGITIGTTAITSGTVGRVLFEGTGNVVSESANLFWDNTNVRLGIGTSSPAQILEVVKNQNGATEVNISNTTGGTSASTLLRITSSSGSALLGRYSSSTTAYKTLSANDSFFYTAGTSDMSFLNDFATGKIKWATGGVSTVQMTLFSTGNLGINTTTDAGFKLDVNGTARVSATSGTTLTASVTNAGGVAASFVTANGGSVQFTNGYIESNALQFRISTNSTQPFVFMTAGTERMRLAPTTGNVLINTNTDIASSKLTIESTTQGFLPPRQTQAQRTAIASPAVGLQVYQTDGVEGMYIYKSTGWALLL